MSSDYPPRAEPGAPTPLISFIIPVFNIESCLAACLDSIATQAFQDIEMIAVDGGSYDGSKEILDEKRQLDPRLTVLHRSRIGPGRARNEGLAHARGRYVWFVDGDDAISSGCLEDITRRLEEARPDVLIVDHEACYPDGRLLSGPGHDLIANATAESFTLAEQSWIIWLTMAPWNKIMRREFLLSLDVPFSSEWPHEEIPLSCLSLMSARKINVLNRICYRYTKDRYGSVMQAGEPKRHFRIFSSYETVLDELEKRVSNGDPIVTEDVRCAFFKRAIWHYTTILDTGGIGIGPAGIGGFIRRRDHREFFERMNSDFRHYRSPGYQPGGGARGMKFRLIEKNAYWAYSALEPVNKVRTRIIRATHVARSRI
jgi:CDP-glycerol glycerophosphotransferase